MKSACLLFLGCAMACAQDNNSANRSIAAQPAPPETFASKILSPFLPAQEGPLTSKERFHEYLRATIGAYPLLREAAAAGLGQARDDPREWGGGAEGYAKRYANDFAKNAVHATIAYGLAAAWHEDNRYFASHRTSTLRRVWHAALSPLETHHVDGSVGVSYSNLIGMVGASAISRAWAPPSWQRPADAAENFGIAFASQAGFNIFREFVPDILHRQH